jgi:hypothetical protein
MTRETLDFLERADGASPEEMEAFDHLRQELFAKIQKFDAELVGMLGGVEELLESALKQEVKEFRIFQEALTHRLLEADSRIIFKARSRMNELKAHLKEMSRGKKALGGYGQAAAQEDHKMNRVA